jgi:hypothetical protein
MRRFRRLLIGRLLGGDVRRWLIYFGVTFGWRQVRKITSPQPELVYRAKLGPGGQVAMATSKPLPRHLRTKQLRKALEAAARADLAATTS